MWEKLKRRIPRTFKRSYTPSRPLRRHRHCRGLRRPHVHAHSGYPWHGHRPAEGKGWSEKV